jgi:hypothetical protein
VRASFLPQAEEKRIRLETKLRGELPVVYADSGSVERVLTNLVGNALKFTEPGGSVSIEASSVVEDKEGALRAAVKVVVVDTGKGIPADQLESVFERFHQVDATDNRGVVGTGLGLSICRELVEAHHGRVWVESEVGRGSQFTFVIPALTAEELFLKGLERDVARARNLPAQLALVSVAMKNPDQVRSEIPEEEYEGFLNAVEAAAQEVARRSTDRVELHRSDGELMAVLLDTPREGADVFARRLADHLRKAAEPFGVHLELVAATAVFPDEAATAERLWRKVQERASASVPVPSGAAAEAVSMIATTEGAM